MTLLTPPNITFAIGILAVIFSIYNSFKKPQIEGDKAAIMQSDRITTLEKQYLEIKETHLRSVEADIKTLTNAVNELSKTVVKLSTIIDERIPKITK